MWKLSIAVKEQLALINVRFVNSAMTTFKEHNFGDMHKSVRCVLITTVDQVVRANVMMMTLKCSKAVKELILI